MDYGRRVRIKTSPLHLKLSTKMTLVCKVTFSQVMLGKQQFSHKLITLSHIGIANVRDDVN